MSYMARPTYGQNGALIDGGVDLNLEAGIAEWVFYLLIPGTWGSNMKLKQRFVFYYIQI